MTQPVSPNPIPKQPMIVREAQEGEINILRLLGVLLRHLWAITGFALALAVFTLVTSLASGRSYTADASFIPQGARAQTSASALAAQFGIGGAIAEGGQSPQFYVDLINSREILRGVVRSSYTVATDTGVVTGDLIKIFGLKKHAPAALEAAAMKQLGGMVSASPSTKTGVITLRATSSYPDLSMQIVSHFLDQINKFNLEGRQSRASAERKFTEERLNEAAANLAAAEDRLEEFLRTNRDFGAPSLTLQRDRLNRTVVARQQIYTALAQADEQARIEEVRDTPAITVIEPPARPIEGNPRGTGQKTIKSFILGFILASLFALLLDFLRRNGDKEDDFQELVASARHGILRPFRRARPAR